MTLETHGAHKTHPPIRPKIATDSASMGLSKELAKGRGRCLYVKPSEKQRADLQDKVVVEYDWPTFIRIRNPKDGEKNVRTYVFHKNDGCVHIDMPEHIIAYNKEQGVDSSVGVPRETCETMRSSSGSYDYRLRDAIGIEDKRSKKWAKVA